MCKEFIDGADAAIRIPMMDSVESLNAAVAAGILMYEAVRQKEQR
ncbi:MAG: TrmH family RNA methyltransferase [Anaerovorax sp.]|nr:TrmH family RNA methyltransferase [Anaerovorax sp.]